MESENNLIELAKLIFESDPKQPYSIQMQIEQYESIEDLFEVLLHLFIYGFKLKEINVQSINSLKPYFHSIGVNFVVDIIEWSEYEFLTNPKYLNRYCSIGPSSFADYDLSNVSFLLSRNFRSQDSLDAMTAVYNHEIKNNFKDSFICFLSFNYKVEF
jgi:hypothetical protein